MAEASDRKQFADRLRTILKQLKNDPGIAKIARESDVSRTTLHKLLSGATPSSQTLRSIHEWLRKHGYVYERPGMEDDSFVQEDAVSPPTSGKGWTADLHGSPAECLIYCVQHREVMRRFSGDPLKEATQAAFGVAISENFSDEELDKLQAWRHELLLPN